MIDCENGRHYMIAGQNKGADDIAQFPFQTNRQWNNQKTAKVN